MFQAKLFLTFLAAGFTVLLACKMEDKIQLPPAESKTLQEAAPFPMGVAINPNLLRTNHKYQQIVQKEYNSITAENAMKWGWLHAQPGKYDYSSADYLVSFAQEHRKRIHGHVLVWYQFNSIEWLKTFQGDSTAWEKLMKDHIQNVVTHFKGKVQSWDVVNEAFNDSGTLRKDDPNPNDTWKEQDLFSQHLGTDYIARAFQYAHEADPNALLFYNDYGQETAPAKTKAILDMVADFKKRGIPIHGLGLQMHINLNTPNESITQVLKEFAKTGLKVHISELDISVNTGNAPNTPFTFTENLKKAQYEKYRFVASQYKTLVPAEQQYGITCWNVGDADSWIISYYKRQDYPLPFDVNYQRKLAYQGLWEGVSQ